MRTAAIFRSRLEVILNGIFLGTQAKLTVMGFLQERPQLTLWTKTERLSHGTTQEPQKQEVRLSQASLPLWQTNGGIVWYESK